MSLAMLTVAVLAAVGQVVPLPHEQSISQGLERPTRLAITETSLFVTDLRQSAVVQYDLSGAYVGTWSEPAGPIGVAVHPDGRILVSRREDGQVAVYDAGFNFQRFLDPGVVAFEGPTDVDVDSNTGRILVVDSAADRVVVFEDDETLAFVVGVRGSVSGAFKFPSSVAVDLTSGGFAIGDQDNYRVQRFTGAGLFEGSFGYRIKYTPGGGSEGWLPRTSGVAFDGAGRIYVADAIMSTLRVFSPTGAELAKVATYGAGTGELHTPTDVALDAAGRVFVADAGAGVVEVYGPFVPATASASGSVDSGNNVCRLDERPSAAKFGKSSKRTPRETGLGQVAVINVWEPPHMLPDTSCGRCHDIDEQPGGHLGLVEGQELLCVSCHIGGGQALSALILPTVNLGTSHAWGVPAINETYGSVGPAPDGPMAGHLDDGLIKCATCHEQHNSVSGTPFLRAEGNTLCAECHPEQIRHTPAGVWQPNCLECHHAHEPTTRNNSLIRGSVYNETLDVDKTVVLTARTGPDGFAGAGVTIDGICQVCHTATTYHRYDGTGAPHHQGADCLSCHPHEAGFMPAGGSCTGCHAAPQDNGDGVPPGGRRAVVGEFPESDAHAHYGAQLDDAACLVCHSLGTHMDGFIELIDADDGSIYRFQQVEDLVASPDVSDFCQSCHDADGAATAVQPFNPFGGGQAPPDVATRFAGTLQWDEMYGDFCFGTEGTLRTVNSHHDISDEDQALSGARVECLDCHGAHAAGGTQPVVDPFDTTTPWTGTSNAFCLSCHAGGTGPLDPGLPPGVLAPVIDTTDPRWAALGVDWTTILDGACITSDCSSLRGIESCDYTQQPWYVDFDWTHEAHGLDSKRGWDGYSGAPDAVLACTDCHDPHGSYTASNGAGNPYAIRDFVDGTGYVDDGGRETGFNGPPWDTFGIARGVIVPIEPNQVGGMQPVWAEPVLGNGTNGLCNVCHAEWVAANSAAHFDGFCDSCQTCHAHGALFGGNDWSGGGNDTPCPVPEPTPATGPGGVSTTGDLPPIHQRLR